MLAIDYATPRIRDESKCPDEEERETGNRGKSALDNLELIPARTEERPGNNGTSDKG